MPVAAGTTGANAAVVAAATGIATTAAARIAATAMS
jgi:hypothetical protein